MSSTQQKRAPTLRKDQVIHPPWSVLPEYSQICLQKMPHVVQYGIIHPKPSYSAAFISTTPQRLWFSLTFVLVAVAVGVLSFIKDASPPPCFDPCYILSLRHFAAGSACTLIKAPVPHVFVPWKQCKSLSVALHLHDVKGERKALVSLLCARQPFIHSPSEV